MHSPTSPTAGKSSARPSSRQAAPGSSVSRKPNYDHLVRPATRLLGFTAKITWKMMKGLVRFAFRIPRLFAPAHTDQVSQKRQKKG